MEDEWPTAQAPLSGPFVPHHQYVYGYNPVGWTTAVSTSVANLPSATYAQTISHDALGRITSQRGGYDTPTVGAEQWFYDASGNISQTLEPMAGSSTDPTPIRRPTATSMAARPPRWA